MILLGMRFFSPNTFSHKFILKTFKYLVYLKVLGQTSSCSLLASLSKPPGICLSGWVRTVAAKPEWNLAGMAEQQRIKTDFIHTIISEQDGSLHDINHFKFPWQKHEAMNRLSPALAQGDDATNSSSSTLGCWRSGEKTAQRGGRQREQTRREFAAAFKYFPTFIMILSLTSCPASNKRETKRILWRWEFISVSAFLLFSLDEIQMPGCEKKRKKGTKSIFLLPVFQALQRQPGWHVLDLHLYFHALLALLFFQVICILFDSVETITAKLFRTFY